MSVREVSMSVRRELIDGMFGEGCYEHPERLLENPEADEKEWRRKPAIAKFVSDNVNDFTKDELADLLNDAAERWAGWRISNMKATIRNKGRESAAKGNAKFVLLAVSAWNKNPQEGDSLILAAVEALGKSEVIRILQRERVLVPNHPLLTK